MTGSGGRDPPNSDSVKVDTFLRAVAHAPRISPQSSASSPAVASPPEPDLTGRTLLHFHVVERLGAGGMGVVYRAIDEQLRRPVALKVLSARLLADARHRETLLREARSAAAVNHPNIASIYEVNDGRDVAFLVMELVGGETLRARLSRDGPLPIAEALRIALAIAQGLASAHASGVVHRDLKCENVMLATAGHVKLLDFGLATVHGDEAAAPGVADAEAPVDEPAALAPTVPATATPTTGGWVAGTPVSMSPEQARGEAADPRTDVYAFGVVLYEMISGVMPFAHRKGRPWSWGDATASAWTPGRALQSVAPKAPRKVADLVQRCLAYDRAGRPADGSALVGEVELCAGHRVPGRATGRSQTLAWVWATIGLVVAAAVALTIARRGERAASRADDSPSAIASARDDGFSRSSNPEAQRLFDEAMQSYHDGTGQEMKLLRRAVQVDPAFASPYLRLWVLDSLTFEPDAPDLIAFPDRPSDMEDLHREVIRLQSTLTSRERSLVEIVEDRDQASCREKMDAYLARYGGDCMDWTHRLAVATSEERERIERSGLAVDPSCVPVLSMQARDFSQEGRVDEALALIDRCLHTSAHAAPCLAERAGILDEQGDCRRAEADTRSWLEIAPDSPPAHALLAGLLAGRGEPMEAVREALGDALGSEGIVDIAPQVQLPVFEGDFAEVAHIARGLADRVPTEKPEYVHFVPAVVQVQAYTEAGEASLAGRAAADYLSRRSAWKEPCPYCEACMLGAAARAGELDSGVASRRVAAAFDADVANGIAPAEAWGEVYGYATQTRREAMIAVAKFDELGLELPIASWGGVIRILFLAGRGEVARPKMEEADRSCTDAFAATSFWVHSELYLGQLDEAAGKRRSACEHYTKVIGRWGHAKPRSVLADEARDHARRLGCGSASATAAPVPRGPPYP